jgi:hypothetical protein
MLQPHRESAPLRTFRISGVDPAQFEHLFNLSDSELAARQTLRVVADAEPGFPCRVSLEDARIGEALLLLPYEHQPELSPYRASGPIFVRRGAMQRRLDAGTVPPYVTRRLISLRGYDPDGMMIDAAVCSGEDVADAMHGMLRNPAVAYLHLHNAMRGCFSCLALPVDL